MTLGQLDREIFRFDHLRAFFRRDLLTQISYRTAFVGDIANLIFQLFTFALLGRIVDSSVLPRYGGETPSYLAFVGVGIAFGAFMQVGLGRIVSAIRNEQLLGTLESLFMTPAHPVAIQLGMVAYDIVYIPLRTALFLLAVSLGFGVEFDLGGAFGALVVLLLFIPLVWGLGMIGAGAVLTFKRGGGIVALAGAILSIGSGAYFPLSVLPEWLAHAARATPFAVAFESARQFLIGDIPIRFLLSEIAYLLGAAAVSLLLGLASFRWALQRERRVGSLGQY